MQTDDICPRYRRIPLDRTTIRDSTRTIFRTILFPKKERRGRFRG
jgi:hypothetical protein